MPPWLHQTRTGRAGTGTSVGTAPGSPDTGQTPQSMVWEAAGLVPTGGPGAPPRGPQALGKPEDPVGGQGWAQAPEIGAATPPCRSARPLDWRGRLGWWWWRPWTSQSQLRVEFRELGRMAAYHGLQNQNARVGHLRACRLPRFIND